MTAMFLARRLRLAALGMAALLGVSGCVVPYQQPPPYSGYSSRRHAPRNDSGKTVHCGVDHDHAAHWYHSRKHHEHYCPGGPHHHH